MENKEKQNIPYYQVAKKALMKKEWNGLSEQEAINIISSQTFDKIESQVYAKGSMDYAIEGIKKFLGLSDKDTEELSNFVYNGGQSKVIDDWKKDAELQDSDNKFNNLITNTLFYVHDGWVKDNMKKFNSREKKHQHMPSELIGWEEAKADLLFIKPIFETAGIEVNEDELKQVYDERVKDFFLDRGIKNSEDLTSEITKGEKFYPALSGQTDILVYISDPVNVKEKVVPQIEENGIGNIEEIRKGIVKQVLDNPNPTDVSKLSDEEMFLAEETLGTEIEKLNGKKDNLQQQNNIVKRIMELAKKRDKLRRQYELAKAEQQNIIKR